MNKMKVRPCLLLIFVILLMGSVFGVRSILDKDELVFSFDGGMYKEGLIALETDTEPLLVSVKKSSNLDGVIDIEPQKDLRVSEKEPLILKLNVRNVGREIDGFLTVNLLYERLPDNVNYYGDDTVRIPIKITGYGETVNKMTISFTEELLPREETTPLDVGVILPVILIVILLLIFRRKWR